MTTQETNPYRQKVDKMLGEEARQAEARKRAEAELEQKLQETIKNGQARLDRIMPQMTGELERLQVPKEELRGAETEGWKLNDELAVGEDGRLYYYPPADLKAVVSGGPVTRQWVEFNLNDEMRASRGPVRLGHFHEGNIDYSNGHYTGGFFEHLDERFFNIVKKTTKAN